MRPRLPRLPRLAGAAAARGFSRAWQRAAERLPSLGRAGRWIVELEEGRPSLVNGPLFGQTLADLTTPEPAKREAARRISKRRAPEEMPSIAAPLPAAETRANRERARRAEDPAAVRNLPPEAPSGEIACWAGERDLPAVSEPIRSRRREAPADRPPQDSPSLADLRRTLTERSRRPLDVERNARPSRQEKETFSEGRDRTPAPEIPQRRDARSQEPATSAPTPTATAPDVSPAAAGHGEALSLPDSDKKVIDPWSTTLAGTKAPRELLERALEPHRPSAEASEPPDRGPASPLRFPNQDGTGPSPALPPSSKDRSEAPSVGSYENRPAPFAPIAFDLQGPGPAPLGPFPDVPASAMPPASPPAAQQAFSLLGPYTAPAEPPRPDDLWELAAKIDRILTDEARRHGIDV